MSKRRIKLREKYVDKTDEDLVLMIIDKMIECKRKGRFVRELSRMFKRDFLIEGVESCE